MWPLDIGLHGQILNPVIGRTPVTIWGGNYSADKSSFPIVMAGGAAGSGTIDLTLENINFLKCPNTAAWVRSDEGKVYEYGCTYVQHNPPQPNDCAPGPKNN
jgi:hypothetical protein